MNIASHPSAQMPEIFVFTGAEISYWRTSPTFVCAGIVQVHANLPSFPSDSTSTSCPGSSSDPAHEATTPGATFIGSAILVSGPLCKLRVPSALPGCTSAGCCNFTVMVVSSETGAWSTTRTARPAALLLVARASRHPTRRRPSSARPTLCRLGSPPRPDRPSSTSRIRSRSRSTCCRPSRRS